LTPLFIFERKGLIMENESKFIRRRRSTILIILTLSLLAAPARGFWYDNQESGMVQITTQPGNDDSLPMIERLSSGRYLVVWPRLYEPKIKYQILSQNGNLLLGPYGEYLMESSWPYDYYQPKLITDNDGGAIVVFADTRAGQVQVYGQRFDSLGNKLWGDNGLPLVEWPGTQDVHLSNICYDSAGNIFISWGVEITYTNGDLYLQKCNRVGQRLWGNNYGVPVCTESHFQMNQKIVPDGLGGVISVWEDQRAGGDYFRFYMQHLHPEGFNMLQENGVMLTLPTGGYLSGNLHEAVTDGAGGGVYTYITNFAENYLHVFRVTEMGRVPWDWSNWNLSSHWFLDMIKHPLEGTFWVSCADNTSDNLYRFDINGLPLLSDQGIPYGGMLAPSSIGVISCMLAQQYTLDGVFVDFSGNHYNTAISEDISHHYPEAISDGADGAICVWGDGRNFSISGYDIFAQRMLSDSTLGSPRPGPHKPSTPNVSLDMIGHTAHFNIPQAGETHLELFDMLGRKVVSFLRSYQPVGEHQLQVNTSSLPSGIYLLRLTAPQVAQAIKIVVMK
jgi:hypothetical protein